jgi:AcrR family transcriptional regulator
MSSRSQPPSTLRSRTREAVRLQVADVAWELFSARGFDAVTVDDVVAAAGISRASFFRYFAGKEDAVLFALDAMGATVAAAVAERPAGEDAWTALRRAFDPLIEIYRRDPAGALARLRLVDETPSLLARQLEKQARWKRMIADVLGPRLGAAPDEVRVEVLVGAALSAVDAATRRWSGGDGDLVALLDAAFDALRGAAPTLGAPTPTSG